MVVDYGGEELNKGNVIVVGGSCYRGMVSLYRLRYFL